jgi:hypothetical protein
MKNLTLKHLAATLGLLAGCGTLAQANELSNGNLDATSLSSQNLPTPTGWTVDASRSVSGAFFDGCSSETWCNVVELGGKGLFFKPFAGTFDNVLTVHLYQDNPASPGAKYTLSGYAAAEANYSGFFATNSPAPATLFVVHFLNLFGEIISSNAFDLVAAGLPNTGPSAMAGFYYTTPEVTAPPGTVTVRAGASILNTYTTTGSQSFFVDGFDLAVELPPGAPVITTQPTNTTVSPGGTAAFSVAVANPAGISYQWQFNQADIYDGGNYAGVNTPTLTVSNVSENEVGNYRVRVSNVTAGILSQEAALAAVSLNFFPTVLITGKLGDTYRVDYSTQAEPTMWTALSTNVLTSSPQLIVDTTSPGNNTRFYRAVKIQP